MYGSMFLLLFVLALGHVQANKTVVFTMCVPEIYWQECVDMMQESAREGIPMYCTSGRDRYDCIDKVGKKEADVVAVDPEDMYLAAKSQLAKDAGYNVIEQVRTKEEPDAPYRYEAVAVIHKDLNISNVQGLQGLKSCHTGVGRNVGYKIPITKLTAMGVLQNINNPEYSARENELRALSTFFKKGCLVGTWSPDPLIHQRLKETYSNMCALCEKPEVCDYPDIYSGYEGALRCLAHNGGDVAWTKVIYVKRFFGLPVGVSPALPSNENPADFRYFCPDGSKVPIDATTKPCTWAARPWQGYMTNGNVRDVNVMQQELTELGRLGETEKAKWWKDLMLLNEKTIAVAAPPVAPEEHLRNAKYMDVIERNSGAPERNARWCVWSEAAFEKCQALAKAAFSRDVRPRVECLREQNEASCLTAVRDNGADLVVLDGGSVIEAIQQYNLQPIISETYGNGTTEFGERAAIAVIKKGSNINNLADLRGKRSCHSGYKGDFAGWSAPVYTLKKYNLIKSEEEISKFFPASCAPGAREDSKLCQLCVGNMASNDDRVKQATKCKPTEAEAYKGGLGALKCLTTGNGDVAFLSAPSLLQSLHGTNSESSASGSDYMLICPNSGLATPENWLQCNLGLEPPRVVLSSAAKTANALEELIHGVLASSSLYGKNQDLLRLFGSWGGQSNLIFKDEATGLVSVENTWDKWEAWKATRDNYKYL
ncbi:transferrin [Cephus cinctus]|uniref:Transferrin n=1 Tax=Cephus cinctus TaxID=211228 RepID=A0AAJ7FV91_CEPCN|nr:transferrin [Cephus cinctus]